MSGSYVRQNLIQAIECHILEIGENGRCDELGLVVFMEFLCCLEFPHLKGYICCYFALLWTWWKVGKHKQVNPKHHKAAWNEIFGVVEATENTTERHQWAALVTVSTLEMLADWLGLMPASLRLQKLSRNYLEFHWRHPRSVSADLQMTSSFGLKPWEMRIYMFLPAEKKAGVTSGWRM